MPGPSDTPRQQPQVGNAYYPIPKSVLETTRNMTQGNFGLWFNKYVPISIENNKFKTCDLRGKTEDAVDCYKNQANRTYGDSIHSLIIKKHLAQKNYCEYMNSRGYDSIVYHTILNSRFLTGIGSSHPNEIGMCFDHTIGIPYISASSIKGAVRFANAGILAESLNDIEKFNDEDDKLTYRFFGGTNSKGKAIFLDAYPLQPPKMVSEIINPHYGKYYDPKDKKEYPADYHDPIPVKFLAVEKGLEFVFRCIIPRDQVARERADNFFLDAFSNGLGAKTAIGFGRFAVIEPGEPDVLTAEDEKLKREREEAEKRRKDEDEKRRIESLSPDERKIEEIRRLKKDRSIIGDFVKKTLEEQFTKEVFIELKEKLEELGEWEPEPGGKSYQKMKERKEKILARIQGGP